MRLRTRECRRRLPALPPRFAVAVGLVGFFSGPERCACGGKTDHVEGNKRNKEEEQLVRRTSASRVDTLEKKKVQAENRNASGGATQDVSGCPATGDPAACIQAAYDEVFANYENNRNAGSHLWMNYITQKLKDGTITFARFQELSTFFCPISGSPLGPNRDRLKWEPSNGNLQNVDGSTASGWTYHCCSPCKCDMQTYVRVDTWTPDGSNGQALNALVISDPCNSADSAALQSLVTPQGGHGAEAPALRCSGNKLENSQRSTNDLPVIGLLLPLDFPGGSATDNANNEQYASTAGFCEPRTAAGCAQSGMGAIFIKAACLGFGPAVAAGTTLVREDGTSGGGTGLLDSCPGCGQLRGLTTTAYEKETANWQRPTECDTQMACSLSSFLQKQAEGGAASALELEKRLVDHPASYHNSGRSHVVFRSTTERAGVLLRAYNKNRASMKSKPSSLSSDFLRTTDGGVAFLSRGAKVEAVKDKAVSGEDDFLYRSEPTARDRQLQRKLKFLARVFPFSAVSSSWRSLLGSRFSTASDAVGGTTDVAPERAPANEEQGRAADLPSSTPVGGQPAPARYTEASPTGTTGAGKPAGEQLLFLSVATGCEGSGSPAEKKKCFADVKKRMYDAMHANHQKLMQAMHWRSLAATVFEPHDAVPLRYFPRQHEHLFFSAATRKESVVFKKLLAVEDLDRSADDSTSRTNKNVEQDNVVIDVLAPLGVMAVFSLFLVIQFRRRRALITKKDHLSDAETSSAGSKGSKASSTAQLFGKRRL